MDDFINQDQISITLTNNRATNFENYSILVHSNRTEISQNTFSCDWTGLMKFLRLDCRNQAHQLDTLFLVCLLAVNVSTCFGRYSPIFRRLCTDAIWCNYVRRMCVDCVQVAVLFGVITCVGCVLTACRLRFLLKMGEGRPKHVEALTPNKPTKKSVSNWC
jgi:hypothetical protein